MLAVMIVFFDLSWVAYSAFERLFLLPPMVLEKAERFVQTDGRTDIGYHTVLAGKGALQYCPPHLRLWRPGARIYSESDYDYKGEVYTRGGSQVELISFSPSQLSLHIGDVSLPDDMVYINQRFDTGWTSLQREIIAQDGRMSFRIDQAAANTQIDLRYAPRSFTIGSWITLVTVLGGAGWIFGSWYRFTRKRVSKR